MAGVGHGPALLLRIHRHGDQLVVRQPDDGIGRSARGQRQSSLLTSTLIKQPQSLHRAIEPAECQITCVWRVAQVPGRSEEHTSELQSLMRISYAVFSLKQTNNTTHLHK